MSQAQITEPMRYRTWAGRLEGAALLDPRAYAAVAADPRANWQAFATAAVATAAQAVGMSRMGPLGVWVGGLTALLAWPLWAALIQAAAGGKNTWGGLFRAIGLAQAPGVLHLLGVVPGLSGVLSLAVGLWILAAGVVAVHEVLRCSMRKAIVTAGLTWLALWLATLWIGYRIGHALAMREMLRMYE